ncbi:MAG: hypothetical protein AB8I08_04625 [Sandaracinaceae bacterium]
MSDAWLEGMMLAAIIAEDERGEAVQAGLATSPRQALQGGLTTLAKSPRDARREHVAAMAAALRHVDPAAEVPVSAARLLASEVPREVGRAWMSSAAPVRRGYRAPPALKSTLRRCAGVAEAHAERDEHRAAEAIDVAFSPAQAASLRRWAGQLAGGRPAKRVLGALALGAQSGLGGDALTRDLRRIGAALDRVWGLGDGGGTARWRA